MLRALACAVLLAVLLAGCGETKRAASSRAPTLAARDPNVNSVDRATPAEYRAPLRVYRRHVRAELREMLGATARLRAAVARHDLRGARAAWLSASAHYETIGAAYGAFGALDQAINGRPGGLPGGVDDARFSGLHRVELALWGRRSTRDAAPAAARLARDVARLRDRVATLRLDPFEYSLRAHEVLEDTLHLQLSGVASRWSSSALVALRANVAGTRVVLGSLRGLIGPRDVGGALPAAERALARIDRATRALAGRNGALPRWDALSARQRERVDGVTAAAAEQLAFIPELIDPRPARPDKDPFA